MPHKVTMRIGPFDPGDDADQTRRFLGVEFRREGVMRADIAAPDARREDRHCSYANNGDTGLDQHKKHFRGMTCHSAMATERSIVGDPDPTR